jgi:glutamate synthase (NADH)
LGWREVPVDKSDLGKSALDTEPVIEQWFITRSLKWSVEDSESQVGYGQCLVIFGQRLPFKFE